MGSLQKRLFFILCVKQQLHNSGFFYYKTSSHFSKQREAVLLRILLRVWLISLLFFVFIHNKISMVHHSQKVQYQSSSSLGCSWPSCKWGGTALTLLEPNSLFHFFWGNLPSWESQTWGNLSALTSSQERNQLLWPVLCLPQGLPH